MVTVIWLVGCANAFNLIDGMDGLAAGVGFVATVTMLIAALTQSNLPLALATMPLAGCLLGFLRYNFNGASVFLGDSGSLLIGFMLGCYGALWSEKSVTLVALTVPLAGRFHSADRRDSFDSPPIPAQSPIFQADRGHIHHRLLDLGLSPKNAVLTMYGICALVAVLSLLASALHNQLSGLIVIVFGGAVWIGIRQLDYTEFATASRMFLGGKFRRIIDIETRMTDFETSLSKAVTLEECWAQICKGSTDFGFQEVRMNLSGRVFEEPNKGPARPRWQLRIPLPNSQYVNFSRDFDSDMHPMVLSAFVEAVQRGMEARSVADAAATEVIRMPAASAARYYTKAATSGDLERLAQ